MGAISAWSIETEAQSATASLPLWPVSAAIYVITLHSTHCTRFTAHCTLHTAHWTLHAAHYTVHSAHCMLHTTHCTLHTAHCTMHIAHCTLHTANCTLYTAHYTLHTAHCRLHTAHCTLHTAHCTLHCNDWPAVFSVIAVHCSRRLGINYRGFRGRRQLHTDHRPVEIHRGADQQALQIGINLFSCV